MKLNNGDLATNAKEIMSVFSMHFPKVLNNHRPVDNSVLELIPQKPCLTNIDTPQFVQQGQITMSLWSANKLLIGSKSTN